MKPDLRMCIWVCFKRYEIILDNHKINFNMEDENNYLGEYHIFNTKKINLKNKKYAFNY